MKKKDAYNAHEQSKIYYFSNDRFTIDTANTMIYTGRSLCAVLILIIFFFLLVSSFIFNIHLRYEILLYLILIAGVTGCVLLAFIAMNQHREINIQQSNYILHDVSYSTKFVLDVLLSS